MTERTEGGKKRSQNETRSRMSGWRKNETEKEQKEGKCASLEKKYRLKQIMERKNKAGKIK